SGQVLDTNGIPICTNSFWQGQPAIAFDGTNYLVVWSDVEGMNAKIRGARVSCSGQLLDPVGITISDVPGSRFEPRLTFNNGLFLVTWTELGPLSSGSSNSLVVFGSIGGGVYGARVTRDGLVLDTNGFGIATNGTMQWLPQVMPLSNGFYVAWEQPADMNLRAVTVSTAGVVSVETILMTAHSGGPRGFGLASPASGPGWLVWSESRLQSDETLDVYGSRLNLSGAPLLTRILATNAGTPSFIAPAVSSAGFWAVWETVVNGTNSDINGAWVPAISGSGTPLPLAINHSVFQQDQPAIACNSGGCLVAWRDGRNIPAQPYAGDDYFDIYATILTTNGAVIYSNGFLV